MLNLLCEKEAFLPLSLGVILSCSLCFFWKKPMDLQPSNEILTNVLKKVHRRLQKKRELLIPNEKKDKLAETAEKIFQQNEIISENPAIYHNPEIGRYSENLFVDPGTILFDLKELFNNYAKNLKILNELYQLNLESNFETEYIEVYYYLFKFSIEAHPFTFRFIIKHLTKLLDNRTMMEDAYYIQLVNDLLELLLR